MEQDLNARLFEAIDRTQMAKEPNYTHYVMREYRLALEKWIKQEPSHLLRMEQLQISIQLQSAAAEEYINNLAKQLGNEKETDTVIEAKSSDTPPQAKNAVQNDTNLSRDVTAAEDQKDIAGVEESLPEVNFPLQIPTLASGNV